MIVRFIHIKKNGGTSVSKFLRKNGVNILHGDSNSMLLNQHNTVHDYLDEKSFKICIVRNPYQRTVSFYNWIKRLPDYTYTFEDYVKNKVTTGRAFSSWNLQVDYIYDEDHKKLLVDKIFRFENMESEIKTFFNINKKFPHLNKSTYNNYEDYYTPELKEIVYERFKKDFELLGYSNA